MKRIVIVLMALFIGQSLHCQSIGWTNDNESYFGVGTNYIIAPASSFFDKQYRTGVALSRYDHKKTGETEYFLELFFEMEEKIFCQQESKAIIKTFSGRILSLLEYLPTNKVIQSRDYDVKKNVYSIQCSYSISEDILNILMKEGIQLIRIETTVGLKDYSFKKDYLGSYLSQEYVLIDKHHGFSTSDF